MWRWLASARDWSAPATGHRGSLIQEGRLHRGQHPGARGVGSDSAVNRWGDTVRAAVGVTEALVLPTARLLVIMCREINGTVVSTSVRFTCPVRRRVHAVFQFPSGRKGTRDSWRRFVNTS